MSLGPVDPSQGGRRSTYGRAYAGQKSAWGEAGEGHKNAKMLLQAYGGVGWQKPP